MIAAILATALAVHTGPYTVREPVAPGPVLVTFHEGDMCRGGDYAYVYLWAQSDHGGFASAEGHYRDHHLSFSLTLSAGKWTVEGVNAGCLDGSWGSYNGVHPIIRVP